jgi:hypothetical protein
VRQRPAFRCGVILGLGVDPVLSRSFFHLLPERRARFQIVHQEFGGGEGGLAMM